MRKLTAAARQRAEDYIARNGTGLHHRLYEFHYSGGDRRTVMEELAEYQNGDGGFGHGIEADLRTANSSVIATTVALQIASSVGAGPCPLVKAALDYLDSQFDGGNWPLVSADCNDAPHAPWWKYDPDRVKNAEFLANPGAEVISHYLTFDHRPELSTRLLGRAANRLAANPLEMHEFLCYQRLLENPKLDRHTRESMLPHLVNAARQLVKVDPSDWEAYCLMPMSVAASPDSLLAGLFGPALDANLDWHITRQHEDGCWAPVWSWGGAFPDTWREVAREISAQLTLSSLVQLDRFGRLQPLL